MTKSQFLSEVELVELGLASFGSDVRIHRNANIVFPENMSLGNNVRIDGFSVIVASRSMSVGSFVHIGSFTFVGCSERVTFGDFSGISQGVQIYTASDDYSGASLTNPTVPDRFKSLQRGAVHLGRHVIIGSNTVVLPGVTIADGAAVGAQSLVKHDLDEWGIYAGSPARRIRARNKELLALEVELMRDAHST